MRDMDRLVAWGWNDEWASVWDDLSPPNAEPARVLQQHRDRYVVSGDLAGGSSSTRSANLAPGASRAATGDWVAVREGGPEERLWITGVLPRRTKFSRGAAGEGPEQVVAANVDTVWIMHGLDAPLNARRLERYLAAAWESGASPVIVLTKADLHAEAEEVRREAEEVALGVPVRVVRLGADPSTADLEPDLESGSTIALLGPSGVGKSSLVNRLLGSSTLPTADVRDTDHKGRHTTTSRQLVRLPGGTLLMDTPGMRELRLFDVDAGIDHAFSDIHDLASGCRYRDCAHDREPGCAVKAAIEAGRLDQVRLDSWKKLRAESEWQARREDPLARREEVARRKAIMKSLDAHPKYRK